MNGTTKRTFSGWLIIVLQAFLGIGAVGGGAFLVIDPTGELMGMPSDIMKIALFPDYLIPGIILLLGLGVFPLIVMLALINKWDWKWGEKLNVFKHLHWSWTFSLYIGFMLIIWITVQAYILEVMAIIHVVYIALGLAIQVVTLLPSVSNYYLKATSDPNRGGERIAS